MTIISPSLLSADFLNLQKDIDRLNSSKNLWMHLDVMDGHFVPNLTFGAIVLKKLHTITQHKLDAHFMVTNPSDYIDSFKDLNIHNFTFHWEAATHHDRLIAQVKENYPSVGVSLNPSTPASVIPHYLLNKIDLILIMTVNPGFGGQSFIDGCVDKIKYLSKLRAENNYHFQIQVDGGVTNKNAKLLKDAGADNLVAGSYIFSEPNNNYSERIKTLRD